MFRSPSSGEGIPQITYGQAPPVLGFVADSCGLGLGGSCRPRLRHQSRYDRRSPLIRSFKPMLLGTERLEREKIHDS